jgi:serine/threonine-protein kinase RsbW
MLTPDPHPGAQDSTRWEANIPNRLPALMRTIEELDRCLAGWGADEQARYLAQLAAEELGTNIIKYGYDDDREHVIRLSAAPEGEVFRLCLEDDGREFNPCLTPEPDPNRPLEDRTPGGWGLSLIRRMATGMCYERRGNRNVISVLVARRPEAQTPGAK